MSMPNLIDGTEFQPFAEYAMQLAHNFMDEELIEFLQRYRQSQT